MEEDVREPSRKRVPIAVALAVVLVLTVTACLLLGPSEQEVKDIRAALKEGALVVDVRSPGEFADGHLRGAINLPVGELSGKLDRLGARGDPLVLY